MLESEDKKLGGRLSIRKRNENGDKTKDRPGELEQSATELCAGTACINDLYKLYARKSLFANGAKLLRKIRYKEKC